MLFRYCDLESHLELYGKHSNVAGSLVAFMKCERQVFNDASVIANPVAVVSEFGEEKERETNLRHSQFEFACICETRGRYSPHTYTTHNRRASSKWPIIVERRQKKRQTNRETSKRKKSQQKTVKRPPNHTNDNSHVARQRQRANSFAIG